MPTEQKATRPPRMHGVVPPPFEIPAEHLPVSKAQGSGLPLFLRLMILFLLARAGFYLLLALVPWSDPQSSVASFLISRPQLVLSLIPKMFLLCGGPLDPCVMSRMVQGLPFLFLFLGAAYLFSAFKMYNMDRFWVSLIRWAIMFQAGATVVNLFIDLFSSYAAGMAVHLSGAMRLAMFVLVAWNLFIFGCFAYFPGVEEAYDGKI